MCAYFVHCFKSILFIGGVEFGIQFLRGLCLLTEEGGRSEEEVSFSISTCLVIGKIVK